MRHTVYLVFVVVTRLFWIAVCALLLGVLFTQIYPYADGLNRMFVDLMGILLGFAILRLASARPRKARLKGNGPAA